MNGVAVVDKEACKACGKCVAKCPKHLIELVPYEQTTFVQCSSHDAVDVVARDAHDGVGHAPRQIQLMQRHEHSQILLAHHALEDGQQLQLIADIEIARRLVEHDELRLLAERAGEQDALPLPVADGLEG